MTEVSGKKNPKGGKHITMDDSTEEGSESHSSPSVNNTKPRHAPPPPPSNDRPNLVPPPPVPSLNTRPQLNGTIDNGTTDDGSGSENDDFVRPRSVLPVTPELWDTPPSNDDQGEKEPETSLPPKTTGPPPTRPLGNKNQDDDKDTKLPQKTTGPPPPPPKMTKPQNSNIKEKPPQ